MTPLPLFEIHRSVMVNDRIAHEEGYNGDETSDRPRSTPPEPPPRRRYLQRPPADRPVAEETIPQPVDWRRSRVDQPPAVQPRGLGPRWPSSPALGAHAQNRHTSGTVAAQEASPLFLRRVVVAGDEYDDVIDDVSAYGLKRSK